VRIQKYIASCGVTSRRKAEELILQGRVKLNGEVVNTLGVKIDPGNDKVYVDDKLITPPKRNYYIMLNKPKGYVTTVKDQFDRPTVLDLVGDINARLHPVGRLDYDTSGLIFLTNDGEFTYRVTHPKNKIKKVYIAKISGIISKEDIEKLKRGIVIDGYKTSPAKVEVLKIGKNTSEVKITIHEGKNRQVRKMFESLSYNVLSLKRIAIGNVTLGNLPEGKWRHLSDREKNSFLH